MLDLTLEETAKKAMNDVTTKVLEKRYSAIEGLAKEFFDKTGLPPNEVELCEQMKDGVITWWFRKREV